MLPKCKAAYEVANYRKNSTVVEDALDMRFGTTEIADAETNNGIKGGKYNMQRKGCDCKKRQEIQSKRYSRITYGCIFKRRYKMCS
jgi:hypothetical protein